MQIQTRKSQASKFRASKNAIKQEITQMKQQHFKKIKQTTNNFHEKLLVLGKSEAEQNETIHQNQRVLQNKTKKDNQRLETEQISSQYENKLLIAQKDLIVGPSLKEWDSCGTMQHALSYDQMSAEYEEIFLKKNNKKYRLKQSDNWKQDEKNMLLKIYKNLKGTKETVMVSSFIQFLQECPLFYLCYNVDPSQAEDIFLLAGKTQPGYLTQKQLIDTLLEDRPILQHFKSTCQSMTTNVVLQAQIWDHLKQLFTKLDTFGQDCVPSYAYLHRVYLDFKDQLLLDLNVLYFPDLQRYYSLRKILFEMLNKAKLPDKINWAFIENYFKQFRHIQNPTLDQIFNNKIHQGCIESDTNYFLISNDILLYLKSLFRRCPQFYHTFVAKKTLYLELLDSLLIHQKRNHIVRQSSSLNSPAVTIENAMKIMVKNGAEYLDLDQFLEYFSIKGPILTDNARFKELFSDEKSQTSAQTYSNPSILIKKAKSTGNILQSNKNTKVKTPKKYTQIKQFKLTDKNHKPTIREAKVQQMIKQKQEQQLNQLNKKYKAKPIPAELNPQRYKAYCKKMESKKNANKQELQNRRKQDEEIIERMKIRTKLLEEKNVDEDSSLVHQNYEYRSKLVPWFTKDNILQQIQDQKIENRKKTFEETKQKYEKQWKKLSDFHQRNDAAQSLFNIDEQSSKESKIIKARQVPNFMKIHQEFQRSLLRKKQIFSPTIIKQFKFTSPRNKPKSPQVKPSVMKKSEIIKKTAMFSPVIKSTAKHDKMVKCNLEKKQMAQKSVKSAIGKNKGKSPTHSNFIKSFEQALKEENTNHNQNKETKNKQQKFKQSMKKLQRQHKMELANIYNKVEARPFLFQQSSNKKQLYAKNLEKMSQHNLKKYKIKMIDHKEKDQDKSSNKDEKIAFKKYNEHQQLMNSSF